MKKRFGLITAVCLVAMIMFGSFTFAYAASDAGVTAPISSYTIQVQLDDSEFTGVRVELINSDGECVNSWDLQKKGKLVADLAPGSYTLREIVEINGYEMPMRSNIMVGSGVIIPYDPNPETIEPDFDPADYIPTEPLEPLTPSFPYYYDKFQQWIDNQN